MLSNRSFKTMKYIEMLGTLPVPRVARYLTHTDILPDNLCQVTICQLTILQVDHFASRPFCQLTILSVGHFAS